MSLYLFMSLCICLALGYVCTEVACLDILPLAVELNNMLLCLATCLHYQARLSILFDCICCICVNAMLVHCAVIFVPLCISTAGDDCGWIQVNH